MTHAKVHFDSREAAAKALLGLLHFGRVVGLRDDTMIVPEAALQWLEEEKIPYQLLQMMNHGDVVQTLRDNLTHQVS